MVVRRLSERGSLRRELVFIKAEAGLLLHYCTTIRPRRLFRKPRKPNVRKYNENVLLHSIRSLHFIGRAVNISQPFLRFDSTPLPFFVSFRRGGGGRDGRGEGMGGGGEEAEEVGRAEDREEER